MRGVLAWLLIVSCLLWNPAFQPTAQAMERRLHEAAAPQPEAVIASVQRCAGHEIQTQPQPGPALVPGLGAREARHAWSPANWQSCTDCLSRSVRYKIAARGPPAVAG